MKAAWAINDLLYWNRLTTDILIADDEQGYPHSSRALADRSLIGQFIGHNTVNGVK